MTRNIAIRGSKKNPQFRIELLKKFGASNDYKHVGNDETGYYYINFHNEIVCNNPDDVPAEFIKSEGLLPILFSTEMVRSILSGCKKKTRRTRGLEAINKNPSHWDIFESKNEGIFTLQHLDHTETYADVLCPYGQPGDILWVRETYGINELLPYIPEYVVYKTDFNPEDMIAWKWKPSIHMPFEAARIFLRIKSVRVERLQDITEKDAISEGIKVLNSSIPPNIVYQAPILNHHGCSFHAKSEFGTLWESINGRGSWRENPWVWVVEFEKL